MDMLNIENFSRTIGETYEVIVGDVRLPLRLANVVRLPPSRVRKGDCFRLELSGPGEPVLPQAIYTLHNRDRDFGIFIVPIASTPTETRYEAIFN